MAMTLFLRIVLGLAVLLLPLGHRCLAEDNGVISRGYKTVKTDFGNFYLGRENLTMLGIGVAGAAVFANTNMDMYIRNKYQDDLRSKETDDATKIFNISAASIAFVIAPAYLGAYGADRRGWTGPLARGGGNRGRPADRGRFQMGGV
jgi:hypothetical protein